MLPQQYSSVPAKSKEYEDANKAIVMHSQCASTNFRFRQPDTQLKSSIVQNASWLPIVLSTSSEHPLVQDELLKLYDIEVSAKAFTANVEYDATSSNIMQRYLLSARYGQAR